MSSATSGGGHKGASSLATKEGIARGRTGLRCVTNAATPDSLPKFAWGRKNAASAKNKYQVAAVTC